VRLINFPGCVGIYDARANGHAQCEEISAFAYSIPTDPGCVTIAGDRRDRHRLANEWPRGWRRSQPLISHVRRFWRADSTVQIPAKAGHDVLLENALAPTAGAAHAVGDADAVDAGALCRVQDVDDRSTQKCALCARRTSPSGACHRHGAGAGDGDPIRKPSAAIERATRPA
jgi:hypothetical protein